ncbi:hypothetical protein [Micromonospora sp. WMMD812]|uniref:hypothetical protein n=1 Tax=Micromonospora sp. WMMD812 TaxID=3015152 RepID=UPI00248B05E8|nr:hypothetical protein [Micromonospora sp. WMMD812]WBB68179.1 hypothetical protein O7603_02015 [Micromonospora sp. WMMD812]
MAGVTVAVRAAADNAQWCGSVCASHGLAGRTDADAWSVPRRSPPWYPDAVTLRPGVRAAVLLNRIDDGPGASVKDSFADLDLAPYGFRVLFAADWIHRPPADPPALGEPAADAPAARRPGTGRSAAQRPGAVPLTPVTSPDRLAAWAAAHGGGALFRPELLADPRVTVLARYAPDGSVAGGAVLHRSGPATGVSNVFAVGDGVAEIWAGICATRPGAPLVGYESGPDLDPALRVGFARVGPLRVWLRD